MVTSPSQLGLKRRRQAMTGDDKSACSGQSATPPSREARTAWDDDFPAEFAVLDRIGEGSFGTVWTARATGTPAVRPAASQSEQGEKEDEGLVALKRINPTCSPSRILNEFNQMRKLGAGRHNVIQAHGVVRTPGGVFALVMPFFEHDDFRQVMKTLTLSGVAAYTRSLLTALAHVHDMGVIHRDVKPRNFMYNTKTGQGLLIDFGLAEPAEKWKGRSEALAKHRDKRAARQIKKEAQQRTKDEQSGGRKADACGKIASGGGGGGSGGSSNRKCSGMSGTEGIAAVSNSGAVIACASGSAPSNGRDKEDRLKLLRKVERGGTTGFRAPEILWHCRDQEPAVDVWAAGVILLCLLSRRYPVFPSADTDEMALVQIAQLLGGPDELVRAARASGRCHIAEFPSLQPKRGSGGGDGGGGRPRLEELCSPLLGGCGVGAAPAAACDEEERRGRADALSLLKGMLTVDPRWRLSAKDALLHPFVAGA